MNEACLENRSAEFDAACLIACAAVVCLIADIGAASYDGISVGKSALVGAFHVRNECLVFAAFTRAQLTANVPRLSAPH